MRYAFSLFWVSLLFSAVTASAHHSPAMFDQEKMLTLEGTVLGFEWTNPHSYIELVVTNDTGAEEQWHLEMGANMYLYNLGWRPSTVKAGDRLTATVAPLRSGAHGGLLLEVRTADGRQLGGGAPQ